MGNRFLLLVVSALLVGCLVADGVPTWEKPKTNQRYIQGPLAERLLVACREGKIIHSEMYHDHDWRRMSYLEQPACGVWLVHGDDDASFDFHTAKMRVDPAGVPIHGESWTVDGVEYDLEACSPVERAPSAHIRLKVTNRSAERSVKVGFIVRNSHEFNMIFGAPDIYRIYNPKVISWKGLDCDQWRRQGDAIVLPSQNLFVTFRGDSAATWDGENGVLRFDPKLGMGETRTYDLVLGRQPEPVRPDYEKALARTRMDWRGILKRIDDRSLLVKCLVVQILQCYARAKDSDVILPRQGGLQRWVWPWDQSYASAALTRLGYGEYVKMACDFYFGDYAQENGMVGPFGMGWVNDTANVLGIFSRHCAVTGDVHYWQKHRRTAEKAFRWIKGERAKSAGLSGQIAGLFPAGIASDNRAVFQAWDMTDALNLLGLEVFARATEKFGEPYAAEVAAEVRDYRGVIAKHLDRFRQEFAGKDTFIIPHRLDMKVEDVMCGEGAVKMHPGNFALLGFFDQTELLRVRKGMVEYGIANDKGLYFHFPAPKKPELGEHVWYTTAQEYNWFYAWKKAGRDDLARQALEACLKWSVTDEYLVGERMHDANPWYFPWCPNASGSGRILQMLLDVDVRAEDLM